MEKPPTIKWQGKLCIPTACQLVCWSEFNGDVDPNPKGGRVSGVADKLRFVWMPLLPVLRGILYTRPTWTAGRDKL